METPWLNFCRPFFKLQVFFMIFPVSSSSRVSMSQLYKTDRFLTFESKNHNCIDEQSNYLGPGRSLRLGVDWLDLLLVARSLVIPILAFLVFHRTASGLFAGMHFLCALSGRLALPGKFYWIGSKN